MLNVPQFHAAALMKSPRDTLSPVHLTLGGASVGTAFDTE